ncbi:MAG: hypothetical protein ACC658_01025 [Acidimicrobiia bacterium]
MGRPTLIAVLLMTGLVSTACAQGNEGQQSSTTEESQEAGIYPDVIAVETERNVDGSYRFDVTISSPYDSPERYADAWRVVGPDGTEYGLRVLVHDHATEQPFTRSLDRVEIPDDVTSVTVEGRDLLNGWGGKTIEVELQTDS